jgi:hypothetical protein
MTFTYLPIRPERNHNMVRLKRTLIPVLMVAASLGAAHTAAASTPAVASGTFTVPADTDITTLIRTADGNAFWAEVAPGTYAGALTGPFIDTDTYVVFKDGSFQTHGTEVCTNCTLGGRTGSFNSVWNASGSGSLITGHLTFTAGTGGFAGLHGGGTFRTEGDTNTYSYAYHFDP